MKRIIFGKTFFYDFDIEILRLCLHELSTFAVRLQRYQIFSKRYFTLAKYFERLLRTYFAAKFVQISRAVIINK